MQKRMAVIGLVSILGMVACEEQSSGFTVGDEKDPSACDLTLDTLDGTEWVFLKANPDKTETPEHFTRLKFKTEGGKTSAKYNVGSASDMYDYNCEKAGEEFICREDPKVKDWCQALVSGGAECTPETLKGIDPTITDEQVKKGMEEAEAVMKKYRDTPDWEKFKFQNNNLGNKLQGLLYVKVDKRNCRVRVTDNYITIYNGKKVEDSNPAGTNPFVKNEMGELLWEGCTNSADLVATAEPGFPENPEQVQHLARHASGKEITMFYLNNDVRLSEEGCTYGYDVWKDGKPFAKDQTPEVVDGKKGEKELRWKISYSPTEPTAADRAALGEVFHLDYKATCTGEGKESKEGVACAAILVQ